MKRTFSRRLEIFAEFLLIGIFIGTIEDVFAIMVITHQIPSWREFAVTALIALPFAMFSELIVDRHHLIPVHKKQPLSKKTGTK